MFKKYFIKDASCRKTGSRQDISSGQEVMRKDNILKYKK